MNQALRDAIADTERFIIEQLGDARGSSLDSAKARTAAVTALRAT